MTLKTVEDLERKLELAQATAARLERAAHAARRNMAILGACAIAFCGWTAYAAPTASAVAVKPDPIAQLNKKMADMEQRLQHNIDLLQLRVKRLEDKPDNVDNPDEEKKSGEKQGEKTQNERGDNSPNSSESSSGWGQSIFNLVQRVTALENRNVFRAPFLVNDSRGHALFIVTEHGGADSIRGVRIFNNSGLPEVELDAGFAEGGVIKARTAGNDKDMAMMFVGPHGPALSLGEEAKGGFYASSTGEGTGLLQVRDENGDVASLGVPDGKALTLRFQRDKSDRAVFGLTSVGSGGAIFKGTDGNLAVATIAEANSGAVEVYNAGHLAAMLKVDKGKGLVGVKNASDKIVSFLTESSQGGGGNITLADPSGNGIVSAGYSASDGGDICYDRKQRLYCVGVNLPLSMSH